MRPLRVRVVGGSIAGCAAAVELAAAGHRVSVHERSPGELAGRGIGIATDRVTMARLVDRGLIRGSTPRVDSAVARYVARADGPQRARRWLGDVELALSAFHWSDLHRGMRTQVPSGVYRGGDEVAAAAASEGVDLVVFADGYLSAGRRLVSPEAAVQYRGLVLWRGLVSERAVDVTALEGAATRIVYPDGHGVAYLIPGPDGAATGERLVMWGFYLAVPTDGIDTVLTGRDGHRHSGSVPFGSVTDAVATALRARLAELVPEFFLGLIEASGTQTSLQAIFSVESARSHRGRSCLVGDAARVFPPFSVSGVLKAIDDAVVLRESLDAAADVESALSVWSGHQQRTAERVRARAEYTERVLVHEVPDLGAITAEATARWLAGLHDDATVRLPS